MLISCKRQCRMSVHLAVSVYPLLLKSWSDYLVRCFTFYFFPGEQVIQTPCYIVSVTLSKRKASVYCKSVCHIYGSFIVVFKWKNIARCYTCRRTWMSHVTAISRNVLPSPSLCLGQGYHVKGIVQSVVVWGTNSESVGLLFFLGTKYVLLCVPVLLPASPNTRHADRYLL